MDVAGWMGGRGWMDEDGWIDVDGLMGEWMDENDGPMDRQTDVRADAWMNRRMDVCMCGRKEECNKPDVLNRTVDDKFLTGILSPTIKKEFWNAVLLLD